MLQRFAELILGKHESPWELSHLVRRVPWDVVGVLAVSLICLLPYFHLPPTDADEGLVTAGADRILRGQIPFRDFFSELGPASFYLLAGIFKVAGANVLAVRLTAWLLGGVISVLIYLLARRLMHRTQAALAAFIFPLYLYPLNYRVDHHWWGNLFLLLMVLTVLKSFPNASGEVGIRGKAWLFQAGVLAATTLLTMQTKGLWAMAMTCIFLMTHPWLGTSGKAREVIGLACRHTAWFLGGAAAMMSAATGYFLYHGAAGSWLDNNFWFLLANYWGYTVEVPFASVSQTLIHLGRLAINQWSVYFNTYFINIVFLLVVAPAVAFGGTGWQLLSVRRPLTLEARVLVFLLLESLGAFFSEYHAHDEYHLAVGAPPLLVLLVYQWGKLAVGGRIWGRLAKGAALAAVAFMLAVAVRKANNALHIDGPVETRRGIVYVRPAALDQTRAVINAIQARVPPGGETFAYPYVVELYFFTETRNPTRYDVLLPEFHSAEQVREALADIRRARPKFVFGFETIQRWTIRPHFPEDPPDAVFPHPLGKMLAAPGSGYHLEEAIPSEYSTGLALRGEVQVWAADR